MTRWAQGVGHPIQFEDWEKLWKTKLKYSSSFKLRENWYKMFFRWYLTSQKLSKFYKNQKKECWNCSNKTGTFLHVWWECKEVKDAWITKLREYMDMDTMTFLLKIIPKKKKKDGLVTSKKNFYKGNIELILNS
uniref:Reverse transcriptase zinc-binding domain-containing protein n=1 Tax=Anolis carolinensis TaxID=28377 RepID=A0A803SPT9_ANOCA